MSALWLVLLGSGALGLACFIAYHAGKSGQKVKERNMTRQASRPRLASATGCAAMLLMLSACAPASRGDFCEIYKPVYTASSDTAETKAMTDDNNAVWLELCAP